MSFSESEKSVTLKNCRITGSKLSEHFEIQLKSGSSVEQSDKTFDVDMSKLLTQKITVSEVVNRSVYEKISCSDKVIESLKVSGGITKQDTVIADDTGAIKLTLWENNIGTIEEGKSYDFSNVIVRTYNNSKYLSLPKEDAGVTASRAWVTTLHLEQN
jgi:ssDNA-binding replication factor A large subunit